VLRRFGLVTTNSITQEFSRRTIRKRMDGKTPVSIVFAIPDHPWTKAAADSAAVRIAMTAVVKGVEEGEPREVLSEAGLSTDEPTILFSDRRGRLNADLTVGPVSATRSLTANRGICHDGVKLHGRGFLLTTSESARLGLGTRTISFSAGTTGRRSSSKTPTDGFSCRRSARRSKRISVLCMPMSW
jgi:hypothetical protein